MKQLNKRLLLLCSTAIVSLSVVFPAFADYSVPQTNYEHMSIGSLSKETESGHIPYRCIYSDLFYIEYPGDFYLGTSSDCPFVFFNSSNQTSTSDNEFHTFNDTQLKGSEEQISQYVKSGGINQYVSEVIKTTVTGDYQFSETERYDGVLMFDLNKDNQSVATIIIWTSFGQLSLRSEIRTATVDLAADYGEILVYPFEDSVDFSSIEALKAFAISEETPFICDETDQITTYQTEHHEYLYCDGETTDSRVALYYPVTPAGKKKWMVAFVVPKESKITNNSYLVRETVIQSFQVLK